MNFKKILGFTLGPLGTAILGFISMPLITWFYSVEDVGRISMLQVFASFSVLLFSLGLDQAYVREYHSATDRHKLFKISVVPGLILMLIIYGLIILINPYFVSQTLYDIDSLKLTFITITCFILTFLSRFLSLILRMEERSVAYSMSQLLPKILFLSFIICSVWFGLTKNIYNLVTAHALSISTVFLVFTWNTRHEWIPSIKRVFNCSDLEPLLSFGLPLVIAGLASWGLRVVDQLSLRSLSTFSELGIYSITMSIAGVTTIFAGIFNTIWAPMVYKWVEDGVDLNKIDQVSEYLLATIYFIVVFSGLLSWILPYFLPTEYSKIQYLITPCILGPLFYTLSETTAIGITVTRKTRLSMLASVLAMLINVVGNYILIPEIGAVGAAISTAFAFYFFFIFRTELSRYVWRNISINKSYLVTTILLIISIYSSYFTQNFFIVIAIWLVLGILGIFMFKKVLKNTFEYFQRVILK